MLNRVNRHVNRRVNAINPAALLIIVFNSACLLACLATTVVYIVGRAAGGEGQGLPTLTWSNDPSMEHSRSRHGKCNYSVLDQCRV